MKFKSDNQRKAAFANMFGSNNGKRTKVGSLNVKNFETGKRGKQAQQVMGYEFKRVKTPTFGPKRKRIKKVKKIHDHKPKIKGVSESCKSCKQKGKTLESGECKNCVIEKIKYEKTRPKPPKKGDFVAQVKWRIQQDSNLADSDQSIFQTVMNIGYDEWQQHEGEQGWKGQEKMLQWTEENLGSEAALIIRLGNYNYQVENGGHDQYNFNGYTSEFDNLIDGFTEHNYDIEITNGAKVMAIMMKAKDLYGQKEEEFEEIKEKKSKIESGNYFDRDIKRDFREYDSYDYDESMSDDDNNERRMDRIWDLLEKDEDNLSRVWGQRYDKEIDSPYYQINEKFMADVENKLKGRFK